MLYIQTEGPVQPRSLGNTGYAPWVAMWKEPALAEVLTPSIREPIFL